MATDFIAFIYYPGVTDIEHPDYAHPTLVDMAELSLEPYAQPGDTTHQGTIYHFPVTGDASGNDPKLHSATHWKRAWSLNGFKQVQIQGSVRIATEAGREDNTTAYTPEIAFDFTLNESDMPDKHMVDSIAINGTGEYTIASIAHIGDVQGGELVTNSNRAGSEGSIGPWRFAELTDTPVVKSTVLANTWTAYDTNAIPAGDVTVNIVCDIAVSIYGNSSVLRHDKDSDSWLWVSVFWLTLQATLRLEEALPDGYVLEGCDAERNPDITPQIQGSSGMCSTSLIALGEDTTTADDVGSVVFESTQSLSPNPLIYQAPSTTVSIDVPWDSFGTGTPTTVPLSQWTDVLVNVTEELLNIVPPQNP